MKSVFDPLQLDHLGSSAAWLKCSERPHRLRSMLDLLTIFSATGLQQELEAAKGEKSLMMRQARAGPILE